MWAGLGAAGLGGAIGLAGAGLGAVVSAKQAKKQRDFQQKMRATAYQATMKDMSLAGLNPILAYKQGATPIGSGSMAMTPDFAGAMAGGASSAVGAMRAPSEIAQRKVSLDLMGQQGALANAQGFNQVNQAKLATGMLQNQKALTRENSAKAALAETLIPRAKALEEMDKTKLGKLLNQATAAGSRITGAVPRIRIGR